MYKSVWPTIEAAFETPSTHLLTFRRAQYAVLQLEQLITQGDDVQLLCDCIMPINRDDKQVLLNLRFSL